MKINMNTWPPILSCENDRDSTLVIMGLKKVVPKQLINAALIEKGRPLPEDHSVFALMGIRRLAVEHLLASSGNAGNVPILDKNTVEKDIHDMVSYASQYLDVVLESVD